MMKNNLRKNISVASNENSKQRDLVSVPALPVDAARRHDGVWPARNDWAQAQ